MATHTEVFNKDARIQSANPDTNYGSDQLAVLYDTSGGKGVGPFEDRSLAYVDFSELDIVAADVTSAYLYMNWTLIQAYGSFAIRWDRVTADWDEATVTWNTQPAIDNTVVSDVVVPYTWDSWNVWDITNMIKDAITNRSKIWNAQAHYYGYDNGYDDEAWYRSSEDVTPDLRPYIIINYTVAGAALKTRVMIF